MHGTKGLTPAMEYLYKAAKSDAASWQLKIHGHDPILKCKLLDAKQRGVHVVKPILCYIWMQQLEYSGAYENSGSSGKKKTLSLNRWPLLILLLHPPNMTPL